MVSRAAFIIVPVTLIFGGSLRHLENLTRPAVGLRPRTEGVYAGKKINSLAGATIQTDLDTAYELLGGVDRSKREKRRAPVTAEAGRYLRRTKQEIATPLYRQKAQLAKVSAAAGRLLVEVTKLAPGLAGVSAPGLLDLNA